jgi:hypothetical protein
MIRPQKLHAHEGLAPGKAASELEPLRWYGRLQVAAAARAAAAGRGGVEFPEVNATVVAARGDPERAGLGAVFLFRGGSGGGDSADAGRVGGREEECRMPGGGVSRGALPTANASIVEARKQELGSRREGFGN